MDETPSLNDEAWKQKVHSVDERLRALREQPTPAKKPKDRKRAPKPTPQPGRLPPILEQPL